MEDKFKKGDRISFDVEGSPKKPYGYGFVSRATNEPYTYQIQPDYPILAGMKIVNVKKMGAK